MNLIVPASRWFVCALLLACCACRAGFESRQVPLRAWEEPPEAMGEPDDEAARLALPFGSFSGIRVKSVRASLDEEPEPGLDVAAVVENSPAAAAGVEVGDILLRAKVGGASRQLEAPSAWRALELELPAGTEVLLTVERANRELQLRLVLVERVAPAERVEVARFREDDKLGLVLRSATEVEARAAGLAPGAGVVLVGMAASSPWRGLPEAPRLLDLVTAVDGVAIDDPARFLSQVRAKDDSRSLRVAWRRGAESLSADLPLARRAREIQRVSVPLLFTWKREAGRTSLSVLLGAIAWESGSAGWALSLLWLFDLRGGDADRLEEAR